MWCKKVISLLKSESNQKSTKELRDKWNPKKHYLRVVITFFYPVGRLYKKDGSVSRRAIDLNMLLGIGGVITFKNGKIDQFLNQIPLENIVLETDAPYLSPVPFRGKRNESGYITYVLKKVAELYDKSELEIAKITTKNAAKIFNI